MMSSPPRIRRRLELRPGFCARLSAGLRIKVVPGSPAHPDRLRVVDMATNRTVMVVRAWPDDAGGAERVLDQLLRAAHRARPRLPAGACWFVRFPSAADLEVALGTSARAAAESLTWWRVPTTRYGRAGLLAQACIATLRAPGAVSAAALAYLGD